MENTNNNKALKKSVKKNSQVKSTLMQNVDLPVNSFSQMISKKPNIVNSIDEQGETLLSYAIKQKKNDICQIILKSRILDLNYQDKNGNSYLHLALLYKLEKIAITLIKNGINVNKINNDGNTCLNLAYFNKLDSIIPILKNNKPNLETKNKEQKFEQDLKSNKKSDLFVQTSRGKTTKENSKSKDRSNNNSNLIDKKANKKIINKKEKLNNNSKIDSKNLKINLLFDKGAKSDFQKIESLPSLREMQKTQRNDKDKINQIYLNLTTDVENKSKHKKFVKENNLKEKKLKEENTINNKTNNIDIGNNTSSETKFKSGTNKDKMNKTNNIDDSDKINDKQDFNLKKEDDIFGLNDFKHFEKHLEFETDLNNDFKKYSFFNMNKSKNFNEDEENMKETYERITKKYVDELIKNSKNNNDKDSDDNENNSQIKEDDEYCVRFEDSGSSDEEINDKNRTSLNMFENSLILNQNNKDNNQTKTRNTNNKDQLKLKNEHNRDNFFLDIMDDKDFSKTIVKKSDEQKLEKLSNKSPKDDNNDLGNQIEYQLYPDNEYKYTPNLHELLNDELQKNERKDLYKNKKSEDYKEPILLPELDQIPKDVEELEDIVKNNSLKEFLTQISMQKYIKNFIDSGFDDMKIILEQAQKGIYIKDSELKEAGILIPGDRAKILIRIQEKSGNFKFAIPKSVYYVCKNINKINNDINIKNLRNWLKNLRIDNYLKNFIYNGYHSIELLFLQMESQSPLTAEILKEEIDIDKVGHRSRIINKLKEDGRSYINKLKTSVLLVGNSNNSKFCDCSIF